MVPLSHHPWEPVGSDHEVVICKHEPLRTHQHRPLYSLVARFPLLGAGALDIDAAVSLCYLAGTPGRIPHRIHDDELHFVRGVDPMGLKLQVEEIRPSTDRHDTYDLSVVTDLPFLLEEGIQSVPPFVALNPRAPV